MTQTTNDSSKQGRKKKPTRKTSYFVPDRATVGMVGNRGSTAVERDAITESRQGQGEDQTHIGSNPQQACAGCKAGHQTVTGLRWARLLCNKGFSFLSNTAYSPLTTTKNKYKFNPVSSLLFFSLSFDQAL